MSAFEPRLATVPFVPEIVLRLLDESVGLWDPLGGEYRSDRPPPFWAFAWPGGQAIARYVLDHPETVAGLSVLDVGCGSGLVAIAAAKAGASSVCAIDLDPAAVDALRHNARANDVEVRAQARDLFSPAPTAGDWNVVLAGDVFYQKELGERMGNYLRRAALAGARVLIGDPDRSYLPRVGYFTIATYDIPVAVALEQERVKRTKVLQSDR